MEGVGNVHFEAGFETGREEIVNATSQSMSLPQPPEVQNEGELNLLSKLLQKSTYSLSEI